MSEVFVDHNTSSPWWQRVRDACSQSEQSAAALLTALVGRRVAADFVTNQRQAKVSQLGLKEFDKQLGAQKGYKKPNQNLMCAVE